MCSILANWAEIEGPEPVTLGEACDHTVRFVLLPPEEIEGRLVRNPSYPGQDSGLFGWPIIPIEPTQRKPKFHAALRKSLKADGMRNPLLAAATPGGVGLLFGSSRFRCARDLKMGLIPVIVNDFTNRFEHCQEVTPANWLTYFVDVPKYAAFTRFGFDYHYSLERNRRHTFDSAGLAWVPDGEDFLADEFAWIEDYQSE